MNLLTAFLLFSGSWFLDDLGIYRPLGFDNTAMDDSGKAYILDVDRQRVLVIGTDGSSLPGFGGRGQGPGEMNASSNLYITEDLLYVRDRNRVHIFTLDGAFVSVYQGKHYNEKVFRMTGGWLARAFPKNPVEDKRVTMTWRPDDGPEIVLGTWYSNWAQHFEKDGVFRYDPVRQVTLVVITRDRSRAFIRPSDKEELHLFDAVMGKIIRIIALPQTRIPFDPEYGHRKLENYRKRISGRGRDAVADFPEFFPSVTGITWTGGDELLVFQATHEGPVAKIRNSWYYDHGGNPISSLYRPEWNKFIVDIRGQWAYVTSFDPENEVAGFGKKPVAELPAFLTEMQASYHEWLAEQAD